MAEIFQVGLSPFIPEKGTLDIYPGALQSLLSTSLPHYHSHCASLEHSLALPVPVPPVQGMLWPPPPGCGPCEAQTRFLEQWLSVAPISFSHHP